MPGSVEVSHPQHVVGLDEQIDAGLEIRTAGGEGPPKLLFNADDPALWVSEFARLKCPQHPVRQMADGVDAFMLVEPDRFYRVVSHLASRCRHTSGIPTRRRSGTRSPGQ
jgi:hypothetical protein